MDRFQSLLSMSTCAVTMRPKAGGTKTVKFVVEPPNATADAEPGACATSSFDSGPYVAPAAASADAAPNCRSGDQALRVGRHSVFLFNVLSFQFPVLIPKTHKKVAKIP
jgi:hypothetical protein